MKRAVLTALLCGAATAAVAVEPRFEPPAPGSYELPPIAQIREHQLLGPDGEPSPLLGLRPGEAAIVSFVYLSCAEACPLATSTLMRLDRELAKRPELARRTVLVTASFDPERDTPEKMRLLRAHVDPKSRWRFLTASSREALEPALANFDQDAVWIPGSADAPAPDLLRHVLKVFLVDAKGQVRNIYSTGFLDVRLLLTDLQTLFALP